MGRGSVPKETITCIERILLEETDFDRGEYLTYSRIGELLEEHYGISVSKDTIAGLLETLANDTLGLPRQVPDRTSSALVPSHKVMAVERKTPTSPFQYAIKRNYPINQIKHLVRHLRDDDTGASSLESENLLLKLVNRSTRGEIEDDLYNSDPFVDDVPASPVGDLRELLSKVELLDVAIRNKEQVRFREVKNGTEQKKPKKRKWTPYLVAPSGGYYYLFVRPQGSNPKYDVIPLRVDTLIDIELTGIPVADYDRYEVEQAKAKRIFRAGIGRWFSRSTADIEPVVIAFSQVACENEEKQRYFFEAMTGKEITPVIRNGNHFEETAGTEDGHSCYRFEASRQAMENWAFKMADLFEVVQPTSLRDAVIAKLNNAAANSAYSGSTGPDQKS